MELRDLIALAGKKFQKSFVVDPRMVRGAVDLGSLTTESLSYHAFLEILGVHGYAAVPSGDVVTIIPGQSARSVASPIVRADNITGDDAEVVTVLIPVSGPVHPEDLALAFRPLIGNWAYLSSTPDGKSLLLVDTVANAKRIVALVQEQSKTP
jgi:general secretion pathway protein D